MTKTKECGVCPDCNGKRFIGWYLGQRLECPFCGGTGKAESYRKLTKADLSNLNELLRGTVKSGQGRGK